MNFEILKMIVLNTSAAILPVLIGALILLGAVSLSPLGRNWNGGATARPSRRCWPRSADCGRF
jgi:hypothetical protein